MPDALVERYPAWMAVGDVGVATGFAASAGTLRTHLGVAHRDGLAEDQRDQVRASPTLFIDWLG